MESIQIIERYLAGEMDAGELQKTETLLATNESFRNEVELHSEINNSLLEDDIEDLRNTISGIISRKNKRHLSFKVLTSIAASVIIVLSFHTIVNTESSNNTYRQYYQTYVSDLNTRSNEHSITTSSKDAFILFEEGKYKESYHLLKEKVDAGAGNSMIYFYLGANATELNNNTDAVNWYKKAITNVNSPYSLHAKWYLGLLHLKKGNIERAEQIMKELASHDNYYKDRARRILRKRIKK